MRKILVVAFREYRAAVRTKAFLISIIMMPLLMVGSGAIQVLFKKLEDNKEKKYLVIDRSPGGALAMALQLAAEKYNEFQAVDKETGKAIAPKYLIEIVPPSEATEEAKLKQRFEISQKIERSEYEGLIEIGANVYAIGDEFPNPEKTADDKAIRFQAKNVTQIQFVRWADLVLNKVIQLQRFAQKGVSPEDAKNIQFPVPVKNSSLTKLDPLTGAYSDARKEAQFVNLFLPAVLIGLMFMIIMVGASPAMQGVVEEKGQRIAEVLLGSVSPFQLMAGKLLGVVLVSLTMAAIYLVGGYILAVRMGYADNLTIQLIATFLVMLVMALLIFGSLFIAVGAAAADIKETQTLLMPIMLMACLPLFALGPIMTDPNGLIAKVCSYIPFATPMVMVARESVPPGIPLYELVIGVVLVFVTSLICVWAAGRIFRIGILMQGKGAKMKDLIQWVIRG